MSRLALGRASTAFRLRLKQERSSVIWGCMAGGCGGGRQ